MPSVIPHSTSPNIGNYFVGRGYMTIMLQGETQPHDCGNVTEFTFQAKPVLLPHFSSRVGLRTKDLVVVTELEATLTMILEEFTARNLAFAALGTQSKVGSTYSIDLFGQPLMYASISFIGTNDVGAKWSADFPLVILSPSKAINMIVNNANTWGAIDLQGDVLKDPHTGTFGTFHSTDLTSP